MNTLTIYENSLDFSESTTVETDNVAIALKNHFGNRFPDNARIFHGQVSIANDVTPTNKEDVQRLQELEGDFTCVVHPEFFLLGGLLGGNLFAIILIGALAYLLRPTPPKEKNTANDSPNNGLTDRRNTGRPNARIPDIYGFPRSTPDLMGEPYFQFIDNREIEFTYLCVGRGKYEIIDVKDGETPIEDIAGVSYEVYGPDTSPNNGAAQFTHGAPIDERAWTAVKSNAVDGQILRPPNAVEINGDADIGFNEPDQIVTTNSDRDFEEFFAEGDRLTIANSLSDGNTVDLDGTYTVLSVTKTTVTLANPTAENSNWTSGFVAVASSDSILTTDSDKWVGPFVIEDAYEVLINVIAPQGLYMIDANGKQKTIGIDIEVEFTEISNDDVPISLPDRTQTIRVSGSDELTNQRSNSARFQLPVTIANAIGKRWQIRLRRSSDSDEIDDDERIFDEIQWRDLYALSYVDKDDFADLTTIMVRTAATSGALSIKERKFNCEAKRIIETRQPGGIFNGTEEATQYAADIIRDIALDPKLGGMTESELDYDSIYGAMEDNVAYFGTELTSHFNHTFDDKNLSAEEMILTVAKAVHCVAYRQGGLLKLRLEKKTDTSVVLFNHRTKIPGTETRTVSFGYNEEYDGVDFDWTNPEDGVTETYRVPTDETAINPKKIETPGIQSKEQAHIHAHREYNKILYRREALEFEGTQEAMTLVRYDKIEVSDNTRPETFDGEVVNQQGLMLELSQPFEPEGGVDYVIQLQLKNKTIQVFDVTPIADQPYYVGISQPPALPLVTIDNDPENYSQTTYQIIADDTHRTTSFLVQEIEPKDNFTAEVRAYNYDERFYDNDEDVSQGIFEGEETINVVFRETFESIVVSAGSFVLIEDPGLFDSGGDLIEIQNNVTGVGSAAEGAKHAEIDGTNSITADIVTDVAKSYDLLLWYAGRPGEGPVNNRVDVSWDGTFFISLSVDATNDTDAQWEPYIFSLPAPATALTELKFESLSGGGSGGLIDDIRVREHDGTETFNITPKSFPGLWMWLDNVEENFDLDPAGGNIDEVDRWYDQSGLTSPHDAYQNTNTYRPLYVRDVGGNYVHFRDNRGEQHLDADQFFNIDNFDDTASAALSIFVVLNSDSGSDNIVSSLISSDDNDTNSHVYFAPDGESNDPDDPFGISMNGEGTDTGNWFINRTWKGGGTHAGSPSDIVTGTWQLHAIILNSSPKSWEFLGALTDTGAFPHVGLRGKIKELIIYRDKLSPTVRMAVEDYLMDKHGL